MRAKILLVSACLALSACGERYEERYPNTDGDVTVVIDVMTFGGAAGSISREAFLETDKLVAGKPHRVELDGYSHESSDVPEWTEPYPAKFCVNGQDRVLDVQTKAGPRRVRLYC